MRKRILVVTQHFWPENFRINDIVEGFLADGIEVDVLCGLPNYPKGEWFDGYDANGPFEEHFGTAQVFRCREVPRKGNTSVRIFLNYVSWPWNARWALSRLPGGYDAVFCFNTSPVLMCWPAVVYARKHRIPCVNYVLDIWPENLYSVLPVKNKLLRGTAQKVSDWLYRRCDRLIAMSAPLQKRLCERTGKPAGAKFNKQSNEGITRMIERRPIVNGSVSDQKFEAKAQDVVRLNKFIANSGVCSRREADTLIQAGVVTVNGEVVTELGTKVNIFNDDIRFNGERLKGEEKVYIIMNKPKGYVTTASDPHAERTVIDLLKGCSARVYPVGRLDKNTTGVLLLTNDGEIAERLTHPSYDKKKIYQVALDRELSQEDYDKILSGVALSDGEVKADELEYIDESDKRKLGIEIHSGKNRVVRRIFESIGYTVKALDRVYFAGLTKKGLKKGEWRYLTEAEVNILKIGAYV